ncbi:MAG: DUF4965 domain-containing protein [Treponema sp.]|jgi:hypothetical protein|nr:DUF4965 domain-containing protein [Treponema sp.]
MNTRIPSVPLITCDPYFSVWSPADRLYDSETVHWTGRVQRIGGVAQIDGRSFRFMGLGAEPILTQTSLEISATSSRYTFEGAGIILELEFLSPLLLDDPDLFSRPLSYIGARLRVTDGGTHEVELDFSFNGNFCKYGSEPAPMVWGIHDLGDTLAAWIGKRNQGPLSHSGDDVTIDWGYLYLAVPQGRDRIFMSGAGEELSVKLRFPELKSQAESFFAAAYDDVASINYFGEFRRGYWGRNGKTILQVIDEGIRNYGSIRERCGVFDRELAVRAEAAGGAAYVSILNLAYRQAIAAHKLITDENGEAVFISKECFSNGCAATVDVSYPSVPLFLLYNPELVKGMLRPILRFARQPAWTWDFAPHDAGRYPHLTGQVYGLAKEHMKNTEVYPPYHAFPANSALYDFRYQMPVEECGNILIMMAAVARAEGNAGFSAPYFDLAKKWVRYLTEYGEDPGEQLCTDDFAGHLAHNCNLAAKAIMGIEAYAILLDMAGDRAEAGEHHARAQAMAAAWLKNTSRGDHTALVFDKQEGWSLKYNLVWDLLFKSRLFPPELFISELAWYTARQNAYGVPLDSRRDYTKSDWILWVLAFSSNRAEREALIKPVTAFLQNTPDRVPFSDWYDTVSAKHYYFQNRTVQGGLFMPLLVDEWAK